MVTPVVVQVLLYVLEFIVKYALTPEVQKITRMDVKGVGMAFAACVMVSPSTDMATMMYVSTMHLLGRLVNV
jgi:hypothetical protein